MIINNNNCILIDNYSNACLIVTTAIFMFICRNSVSPTVLRCSETFVSCCWVSYDSSPHWSCKSGSFINIYVWFNNQQDSLMNNDNIYLKSGTSSDDPPSKILKDKIRFSYIFSYIFDRVCSLQYLSYWYKFKYRTVYQLWPHLEPLFQI